MNGDTTKGLTQKTWINISLALILISTAFWGGYSLAEVRTQLNAHEKIQIHSGAVSREAIELQLKLIDSRLKTIESDMDVIKKKLE